ncbi:MAG: YopX family protein [Bacillus sp. (in: firmicutes)]
MREIKYKAFMKKWHEMGTVESIDFLTKFVDVKLLNYKTAFRFNEVELLQYTGLKDKNGKEIYEGDIVRVTDHPFEGAIRIDGNYEVGYNEQMELCCGSCLLFRMKHYCEVIGNIYENLELLG